MKIWSKVVTKTLYATVVTVAATCSAPVFSANKVDVNKVAANKELNFYNRPEYIPASLLEAFTEQTGIAVRSIAYEPEDNLYAQLKEQQDSYDLVAVPSHMVSLLRENQMLRPLDKKELTHFNDLERHTLNKLFDPQNQYSVPYLWGATGIGINVDMLDKSLVTSWSDLWDPSWEGQLMVFDQPQELFHIALLKLGYSANTINPDEIEAAYEALIKLMPNILVFNSDFPANPYLAGETPIGMLNNGSAYTARQEGGNIEIVWPEEGAILWADNLVIPVEAANTDEAHALINFLLKPENAAKIALKSGYPTTVKSAYPLLPSAFIKDVSVFPPQRIVDSSYWRDELGKATSLYEEYFEKLKIN